MDFPFAPDDIPFVDTRQMVEVDRAMIEDYHIDLIQMMENAGRNLAHLARTRFLQGDPQGKKVTILAGTGGNGGGALVCARRLHNYGGIVSVLITKPAEDFSHIPAHQLDILQRMKVPVAQAGDVDRGQRPDLIVDGLIGYSLKGAPRGTVSDLIHWANAQRCPILALDAPSGLDTTAGTVFDPAIQATATLTLALPKKGLLESDAISHTGELYLADISVPPQLYSQPPLDLDIGHIFAESDILRLH